MVTGHERADGSGRRAKPTSARAYGWMLGGKDNDAIDREFILAVLRGFPECAGIAWQTRTPARVDALLEGLEPVAPGLVNIKHWRPDPSQPPLDPVPTALRPYVYEYGGVLRKT